MPSVRAVFNESCKVHGWFVLGIIPSQHFAAGELPNCGPGVVLNGNIVNKKTKIHLSFFTAAC